MFNFYVPDHVVTKIMIGGILALVCLYCACPQ